MQALSLQAPIYRASYWALMVVAVLSPMVSLVSGPSLAVFFVLAALGPVILWGMQKRWGDLLNSPIYKVVLAFFAVALLSALWAIVPAETFSMWCRMGAFFIGSVGLFSFLRDMRSDARNSLLRALAAGLVVALVAANVEIICNGVLTKFIQSFKASPHPFELTDLNRGSSYISIMFWPVFAWLLLGGRRMAALVLLAAMVVTVFRLESQGSSVALVMGLLAFIWVGCTGRFGLKMLMPFVLVAVVAVAVTAKMMDPVSMFKTVPNIPNSASQIRLYIWHYAATRASERPWLGWGFNAARSIPVPESDYVMGGRHPLPLHPHNNVLQMWLELGVLGLVLFAAFLVALMQSISRLPPGRGLTEGGAVVRCQAWVQRFSVNRPMALAFGLMAAYFCIGETGYGIWQNWWVAGGLLAAAFVSVSVKE